MKFYPPKISERCDTPEHAGEMAQASATGTSATFVCGAVLRFSLRIETEAKRICEAKFKTNGCGYAVAAAETLARLVADKYLSELHRLDEAYLRSAIETELEKFPADRAHCLDLAVESLRQSFADFRRRQVEEFTGEKALVCTCFGVSEETVENLVREKSVSTVEQVADLCNAGGGCGSCQPLIQEIIDSIGYEGF